MAKAQIKRVGLFGKHASRTTGDEIRRLRQFLRERKLEVLLEDTAASLIEKETAGHHPLAQIGKDIDLAIVIGGDGTLLSVARALADFEIPLIGVNLGRLGFLTDIAPENMLEGIGKMLDGEYVDEERFLLAAEIMRDGAMVHASKAVNDVIINKGELSRLIEFETYVDDQFVNRMLADGIIVATPTGSTAYALSAGGPLLHPALGAIVLVPICPHTLSDRPIVISSNSVVRIVMIGDDNQRGHVTFDGQLHYPLRDRDQILVRRASKAIHLWHPAGRTHYDVLRAKLHWGSQF